MKGCRKVWRVARVGLLALACAAACSCSSPEEGTVKPRIDGSVSLSSSDADATGQAGVKITLLRGDVHQKFAEVYRSTPEAKARRALIASLDETRRQKEKAYERAATALSSLDLPALATDPASCERAVEARLTQASSQLLSYIRSVDDGVAGLDLPVTDLDTTLRELEKRSQREEGRALNALVEEYQNRHLELQTSVLYDGRGPSWDRLCWRITNGGHLNLANAQLSIHHNGRRLPIETVRLLWKIPGDSLVLDFEARDSLGGTVYGLEAGGSATGCFFAAERDELREQREWLESQGLTSLLSPRSGEWKLVFEAVSVTRAARVETTDRETAASYRLFPPQALDVVFAPELMARRSTFRAQRLLEKIKKSPAGLAWEHARKASRACRTVLETQDDLRRIDEKLASLHNWADADPVMEGRVTMVLEEMGGAEQDPTDAEEALARVIAEQRWGEVITSNDGKFAFAELPPETYSLIARYEAEGLGWMRVVRLSEPITITLRREDAVRSSPAKVLARLD